MASKPNLEELLQMGITAAKNGNKEGARKLFRRVLNGDKTNDRAWVWLAKVAENKAKRRQYLETAIKVNPNNRAAKEALSKMAAQQSGNTQRTLMIGLIIILGTAVVAALFVLLVIVAN